MREVKGSFWYPFLWILSVSLLVVIGLSLVFFSGENVVRELKELQEINLATASGASDVFLDTGIKISNVTDSVDVFIQDQTTPPFDLYFIQSTGVFTSVLTSNELDGLTIELSNVSGFVDGSYVGIFCPDENRYYFANQIGAPTGNNITLDTPLDFVFEPGDNVLVFTRDLNVDGSVNTQVFEIQGPGGNASIDITRIMIQAVTDTVPQLTDFGDITNGLANGIVLRRVDGDVRNVWNVKQNLDFAHLSYDYQAYIGTNPGVGINGFSVRYTFAGQDKHGVAVRLEQGESLELWIQDDLSSLDSFRILAEGHIVD